MRRLNLPAALLAALALGAVAACAPNPIVARDPIPAPGPQDAFVCDSRPMPLNTFRTNCDPVAPEPVLRAKG
ncbi:MULTISPECIES: hypothetical protein [Methylobacterium]|jgi:hypothetical protein|uniref:Lipoprotein n=1 Tax=Methylobacterium hispanicum TaxID=270350 RepID=A0AAV4ZKP5_9HYPH|nr:MULTISPECIES: hypothetical protein [Methylobacterium]GJD89030.1 hypothetical protein BHAOGJBA_2555 [Methylobacterium hispanicum]